jgi:ATP synthase protein I
MDFRFPRPKGIQKNAGVLVYAGTMGLHLVSGPAVGFGIGWLLDDFLGTDPWLKAVFFLLGVISGFKLVYDDARKIIEEPKEKHDHGTGPPD